MKVIWSPLVRIIHWTLVTCFIFNYWLLDTGELAHQVFGYTALCAVLVRIIWGFYASDYASFRHINFSRRAFKTHCKHLHQRNMPQDSGHNPVGWLMIIAIFILIMVQAFSGFLLLEVDAFFGDPRLKKIHSLAADTLFVLACVHVVAVIAVGRWANIKLIRAMFTGKR